MNDFIQLKKDDLLRLKIKDQFGNDVGEELVFDLQDIELPLRYQEMYEQHKKNINYVQHQFIIIDKRNDIKGKKLFSKNEEDKLRLLVDFYKREMECLDMFIGKGKTQMLLDLMGRKPYIEMFDDIGEMLKSVEKYFEINFDNTQKYIQNKYKMNLDNVLENE